MTGEVPPTLCDRPHCHARLKNKNPNSKVRDGRCHKPPLKDRSRCKVHGGATPQAKLKAAQIQLERSIGAALESLGVQPVENPLVELQKIAGYVTAWLEVCRQHLNVVNSMGYSTEMGEQVRAEILVWERAQDRAVHTLATLGKLNIDARLAAIEERQAEQVEAAFAAAMAVLGLDLERRSDVEREFARHLRIVEAG